MHIVWVNQHASLVGGAEHYIVNTARHLRAHDIRSTLVYDPNQPTAPEMLDVFDAAFPLVREAHQISELKPDLIFVHQTRDANTIAQLAASQCPVVEFFHDHWLFCLRVQKYTTLGRRTCTQTANEWSCYPCLGFVQRQTSSPRIRLRTISDLRHEHALRGNFAGFVTGSQYMAGQAVAHGFDPKKVHVTPLYAETPESTNDSTPRESFRLLYVGAILPYKGVDVLIKALAQTSTQAQLDLIGEGTYQPEMANLVEKLGLGKRVRFLGRLKRHEISAHYRRATCLVLPSRTPESFGIVGAEAMAHGLPAIVSDIGGALEWLEPGRTGLTFPINDAQGLANAIDLLLSSPALAHDMSQAARQRYQDHFRPEHHVARLLDVFQSVLGQRGQS
jgi:glycosyltransferase involved in cell wall biosynthesis